MTENNSDTRRKLVPTLGLLALMLAGAAWHWLAATPQQTDNQVRVVSWSGEHPVRAVMKLPDAQGKASSSEVLPLLLEVRMSSGGESGPEQDEDGEAGASGRLVARLQSISETPRVLLLAASLVNAETQGRSLAGARILLGHYSPALAWSGQRREASEHTGLSWTWENLPAGPWRIEADPASELIPANSLPVIVRAGSTSTVDLMLVPSGQLCARLETPDGAPVAAAKLRVLGPVPPGFDPETTSPDDLVGVVDLRRRSDENGEFVVRGLVPGESYVLRAWTAEGIQATATLVARAGPCEPETVLASLPVPVLVELLDSRTGEPVVDVDVFVCDHRLSRLNAADGAFDLTRIVELRAAGPTDAAGQVLVSCEPGAWVLVNLPHYDMATLQVTEAVVASGRLAIRLDPAGCRIIQVTTADGGAVADASVDVSWVGLREGVWTKGVLATLRSDSRGECDLAQLGELPVVTAGTLRLAARHPDVGLGAVEIMLLDLAAGRRSWPKTIILRQSGGLVLHFGATGWPRTDEAWAGNPADDRERRDQSLSISLSLRYLGNAAARTEFSTSHGDSFEISLSGLPGDEVSGRFDELEPGVYAVVVASEGRGFRFTTPSLRVLPGETTQHWVEAPDPELFATVTLDLGSMPVSSPRGASTQPEVLLKSVMKQPGHGSLPVLLPPTAGELEVRRDRLPATGRIVFRWIQPGHYTIRLPLQDPNDIDGLIWRNTRAFSVGPGDDILLRTLE